jgi:hypothetical protein
VQQQQEQQAMGDLQLLDMDIDNVHLALFEPLDNDHPAFAELDLVDTETQV